jgi:hypothetical protein
MNKIKDKIAIYLLKKESKNVADKIEKLSFYNFQKAKSILLLAYPKNDEDIRLLNVFEGEQKKEGKTVKIVVFYQLKDKKPVFNFPEHFIKFSKNDFDWLGRPKSEEIKQLLSQNFDVLIDLNFNHIFALEYLSQLSIAAFKVGLYSYKHQNQYNFMIEGKGENLNYKYFITNTINYLKKINQ